MDSEKLSQHKSKVEKIQLSTLQKQMPLSLSEGKFLTLETIISKKLDASKIRKQLERLTYYDKKKIVLERYKLLPVEDAKLIVHIIGRGSFSMQELLEEIERDTMQGKELVNIEIQYISRILHRFEEGKIKL